MRKVIVILVLLAASLLMAVEPNRDNMRAVVTQTQREGDKLKVSLKVSSREAGRPEIIYETPTLEEGVLLLSPETDKQFIEMIDLALLRNFNVVFDTNAQGGVKKMTVHVPGFVFSSLPAPLTARIPGKQSAHLVAISRSANGDSQLFFSEKFWDPNSANKKKPLEAFGVVTVAPGKPLVDLTDAAKHSPLTWPELLIHLQTQQPVAFSFPKGTMDRAMLNRYGHSSCNVLGGVSPLMRGTGPGGGSSGATYP